MNRKFKKTSYLLGMDSETTGMAYANQVDKHCPDPTSDVVNNLKYHAISWGLVVIDPYKMTIIDKLYVTIKHDDTKYEWSKDAEKVHGLSRDWLEQHGETRLEAAILILEFILKYWDLNETISTIGHNQVTFDHWFFRELLNEFDMMVKFGNRHIDTNYLTLGVYDVEGSNELFQLFNDRRVDHNALDDIIQTVNVFFETKKIFNSFL